MFTGGASDAWPVAGSTHLRGLLGHRRHRPDVRHHARPRQRRSLGSRHHDACRHGRAEAHGCRATAWSWPGFCVAIVVGLVVGLGNYALIKAAAHSADHRHAVHELHRPVRGDLVRTADCASSRRACSPTSPRRIDARRAATWRIVAFLISLLCLVPAREERSMAAGSRRSARTCAAARMAGIPVDGTRFVTYVFCAVLAVGRGFCSPASPAAPRSTWARNIC